MAEKASFMQVGAKGAVSAVSSATLAVDLAATTKRQKWFIRLQLPATLIHKTIRPQG